MEELLRSLRASLVSALWASAVGLVCLQLVNVFHENLLVLNTFLFTFRYRL
jgi:hypothetical protein